MVAKMKVAKEAVDQMVMERVLIIGPKQHVRCRNIVAKFLQFKDTEFVRKQWNTLEGTPLRTLSMTKGAEIGPGEIRYLQMI